MSLSELYVQGGAPFMHPITLVFLANLIVIILIIMRLIQKKQIHSKWIEAIKQLGGLASVLGAFGTIIGFYYAFSSLEAMTETLPLNIISGGVKVALITVLYGLIVHIISLSAYILINFFGRTK